MRIDFILISDFPLKNIVLHIQIFIKIKFSKIRKFFVKILGKNIFTINYNIYDNCKEKN